LLLLTRKQIPNTVDIRRPALECWVAVGWYVCYMGLSTITRGEGIIGNEVVKWLWFVILPLTLLWVVRRRSDNIATLFKSVGLQRQNIGRALLLGFLTFLILLPFIMLAMSSSQTDKLLAVFQQPFEAIILVPVCFILMVTTAGFTEEMLFRGIIQSRLTKVFGSEMRSCLLTAFLFGIYHLPFAYFSTSWPTHGNVIWAVASVLTEQMVAGIILGTIWARTHNLAASVLLHSLINLIPAMTMIHFNFR
jgi:membrane protease YdiL (CAAX protease family)